MYFQKVRFNIKLLKSLLIISIAVFFIPFYSSAFPLEEPNNQQLHASRPFDNSLPSELTFQGMQVFPGNSSLFLSSELDPDDPNYTGDDPIGKVPEDAPISEISFPVIFILVLCYLFFKQRSLKKGK